MQDPSVVIVGAGFGGIAMAVALKAAGFHDFTILERAGDIGGVWRDNHYPGAACDVPAVLYSYSFEADYPWSTGYPPQAEILQYMHHVVHKYGLMPHIRFDSAVTQAAFDAAKGQWLLTTAAGGQLRCAFWVSAVGIFNDPAVPAIEGAERFKGPAFHSARWRHDIAMREQRVAVVGTGSSAVQIVPALVQDGALVTLYQRTAPYVLPKSVIAARQPVAERERLFAEFEAVAGRRMDHPATAAAQAAFLQALQQAVPDPVLRRKLTPHFTLGCKRSVFSSEWYTVLQGPSVELVTDGIRCIEADGLRTVDGRLRPADRIIYATGFNPSNYLPGLRVTGRAGRLLSAAWADGAEAYLGMAVHGFPNMFLLFGPNTNVPGSVLFMLECQARYIVGALQALQAEGAATLEVREPVMRQYCDALQREIAASTQSASHCRSYYMNHAGKVVTNYPGTQSRYRDETAAPALRDYLFTFRPGR